MALQKHGFELSTLEQKVMLAIMRQHPSAYGVSIQEHLSVKTGREYSLGSIYAVLERLTEKGFVKSRSGDPTAERGGKRKMFFSLSGEGAAALEGSLNALDVLRKGNRWKGVTI